MLALAVLCTGLACGLETTDEARAFERELLGQAGRDKMFYVEQPGGPKLNLGGYMQFRYYGVVGGDQTPEDVTSGFTMQRTRLLISGKLAEPKIEFLILPSAGPNGKVSVFDAWTKWNINDQWSLTIGQFKLPLLREWLVAERYLLAIERSVVNTTFCTIYSQGVQAEYKGESLHFMAAVSDGIRGFNTPYDAPGEADYALTARLEALFDGTWAQFGDITSLGNEQSGLMGGVAIHHQGHTDTFAAVPIDTLTELTLDLSWEGRRASIMAGGVARYVERDGGDDSVDCGVLVQGGVFVSDTVELYARGAMVIPDSDSSGDDPFPAITGGLTWYIAGHALRFKADAEWFPNDLPDTVILNFGPDTGSGLLGPGGGQVAVRAELQLVF
ncbi:MAG: hypothetical protein KJZ65_07045 [Phycisphaerales bacterium]|nr:hypothetical protein [Phycisphaerales bacterium]